MKVGWKCGFGLPSRKISIKSIIACRVLELKILESWVKILRLPLSTLQTLGEF
jgi:hypothetical protein